MTKNASTLLSRLPVSLPKWLLELQPSHLTTPQLQDFQKLSDTTPAYTSSSPTYLLTFSRVWKIQLWFR